MRGNRKLIWEIFGPHHVVKFFSKKIFPENTPPPYCLEQTSAKRIAETYRGIKAPSFISPAKHPAADY